MSSDALASGFSPDEAFMSKLKQAIGEYKEQNPGLVASWTQTAERLDQSSPAIVSAVNDFLIPAIGVPSQLVDAANITILLIQLSARGMAQDHGWSDDDCVNPDKLNSTLWSEFVLAAIMNCAGWVIPRGHQFSNETTTITDGESIATTVANAISKTIGPQSSQVITDFSSRMTEAGAAEINNLGRIFWIQKPKIGSKSFFGFFPYVPGADGNAVLSYTSVFVDPTPDDWRSLFVNSDGTVQVSVWSIRLLMLFDMYKSVEDTVKEKLGPLIYSDIRSRPMPGS